jgi:hypothetical protein
MSDNSEPVETEQQSDVSNAVAAPLSHRRILAAMFAVTIFGAIIGFLTVSSGFGFGILFGGALSFVNYFWLKNSLRRVFERADFESSDNAPPRFLAGKYFLRYAALGALLAIVFLTKTLPVAAVLLGLASFAFAVVIEGSILIFSSFFKK